MQGSRSSSITTTFTYIRRAARTAITLVAMSACAGDRAVVEPGGVAVSAAASASASEGWTNVHLLEETTPGSVLWVHADHPAPDERYVLNYVGLAKRLKDTYGDIGEVDFLIVLPTKPLNTNNAYVANRSIAGIGSCAACSFAAMPQVKNIIGLAFHAPWLAADTVGFDPMIYFKSFQAVLLHEVGHYWLMGLENFGNLYPGHYQNTLDLFYGDPSYVDPLAIAHWIRNKTSDTCVGLGSAGTTTRFADLSLYLMGFIPPWDVAPVTQHEFQPIEGNNAYNAVGPICGEPYTFTGQRVITMDDIVALHGVRNPSYTESQRHFRAMFIVVHSAGEVPRAGFLKYASAFADSLPASWERATRGHSTIKVVHTVRTSELQP